MLVEYLELDGDLHAVAASAGRFRFHRLGSVAAAEKSLESLRTGLRWLAHGVGSARSLTAVTDVINRSARELDVLLLGPLLADGERLPLVVVPTGALHAMPWAALPSCAGRAVSVAVGHALVPSPRRTPHRHRPGRPRARAGVAPRVSRGARDRAGLRQPDLPDREKRSGRVRAGRARRGRRGSPRRARTLQSRQSDVL